MEKESQTGQSLCEQMLAFLMNRTPTVCFEVSFAGDIEFISPSIEAISDFKAPELIKRSMWNLYVDMNAREALMETLLRQGVIEDHRVELKDKDGRTRRCRIDATLVHDEQGKPLRLFGTLTPLD